MESSQVFILLPDVFVEQDFLSVSSRILVKIRALDVHSVLWKVLK